MEEEDSCRLCGEKLDKKENSALYYCLKCAGKYKGYRGTEKLQTISGTSS